MDRRVLITGSTRGLGLHLARSFVQEGDVVGINGRSPEVTDAAVHDLRGETGGTVVAFPGDITSLAAVSAIGERLDREWQGVDILVNNAVLRTRGAIGDVDLTDWTRCISVTLTGTMLMSQIVVPRMQPNGWGRIINIGGASGMRGAPGRVATSTAKSGLIGLTKSAALDLAETGITVNVVAPGPLVRTDAVDEAEHERLAIAPPRTEWEALVPLKRRGTPVQIAAAVQYLSSRAADFVTGETINLSGGLVM